MKDIFGQEINPSDWVAVAVRGGWSKGMKLRIVKKFKGTEVLLYDPKGQSGAWHMVHNVVKAPDGWTPPSV